MRCERSPEPIWPLRADARAASDALALQLVDARAQHLHGEPAVLMLRLLRRDDDDAGRQMRHAHRRVRLVDVLAAGPARPHRVDADVLRADIDIDLLRLRQHGDGRRRSMDAPARLGRRDALHAMHAGLELQPREHAFAGDRGDDLLVAAEVVLRDRDDLHLPAAQLGVAAVHAEEIGSEQRRLVAAGAGAHFENGAALVGGVLRQELDPQLLLQFLATRLERFQIGARHGDHLLVGGRVIDERREVFLLPLGAAQRLDGGDQRIECGELLRQLRIGSLIDAGVELGLDGVPAPDHLLELVFGNSGHGPWSLRNLEWRCRPQAQRPAVANFNLGWI